MVLATLNVSFIFDGLLLNFVCSIFKPKEFVFAARFLMYGLDQKLSSCEHLY